MDIAILGTGTVGRALTLALHGHGHRVRMGTRDKPSTLARMSGGADGLVPPALWFADHREIRLAPYREAAAGAELIINATSGSGTLSALGAVGADQLADRVLLDVSNPLDFARGYPPRLSVSNDSSLAEQVQAAFPATRVVKSLNTVAADIMVNPGMLSNDGGAVFMSGDDSSAKDIVADLLHDLGWTHVIDLGDLTTARGAEMLLPFWLRLADALDTSHFNIAVAQSRRTGPGPDSTPRSSPTL